MKNQTWELTSVLVPICVYCTGILALFEYPLYIRIPALYLNDDTIAFGGFRLSGKYVRFQQIGENVNGMKKGNASLHKNAIFNLLEGPASEVTGNSKEEFLEKLEEALAK